MLFNYVALVWVILSICVGYYIHKKQCSRDTIIGKKYTNRYDYNKLYDQEFDDTLNFLVGIN